MNNAFPIAGLTNLEQVVMVAATRCCIDAYGCEFDQIVTASGLLEKTVKEAIGSLLQKGHLKTGRERLRDDLGRLREVEFFWAAFGGQTLIAENEITAENYALAKRVEYWEF